MLLNPVSANPLELFSVYGSFGRPAELQHTPLCERRNRARTRLHWPVLLFRKHLADAIESLTRDLSSEGFYCTSRKGLTPGEVLTCILKVPTHDPNGKQSERSLECRVRVTRVERQEEEDLFGVACRIEDYHFAQPIDGRQTHSINP